MRDLPMPKVSIITPSFNQGCYIEQNIQSVLTQNYPNIEHIIVDGGSTDETVGILSKYPHLKWVSEKDKGQADALNKGLAMSSGELIGWINSDDYYAPNIFTDMVACFNDRETQWVIGNISLFTEETGSVIRNESPFTNYDQLIRDPDIVRQQGTFIRRSLIEKAGGWNPELYMVMDYDLWIRIAKISPPKMVNQEWAFFRCHEAQKSSYRNSSRQAREIRRIFRERKIKGWPAFRVNMKKRWYILKGVLKQNIYGRGGFQTRKEFFQ